MNSRMHSSLLICFIVIYSTIFVSAQFSVDDECRTPDEKPGTCVPIEKCDFIQNWLLNEREPSSQETITILQTYHCGYSGVKPNVCCPNSAGTTTPRPPVTTIPMTARIPGRKDMSNHPNFRLINQRTCGLLFADKIVGGNETSPFEFPWMALIAYNTGGGLDFKCGGTLINERYILTAAHCITSLDSLTLAGVRLGEHNIRTRRDCIIVDEIGTEDCAPPVQDFRIEEVIPHEQFSLAKLTHDIGLLRLAAPADITPNVKTICLPIGDLSSDNLIGKNATVAGWGVTESGFSSPALLKALIPVIPTNECQARYDRLRAGVTLVSSQLCAGGIPGVDSCSGDSGGPLKKQDTVNNDGRIVQFGVVSFGPRFCGQDNQPGVYTRVDHYMDWILDHMRP